MFIEQKSLGGADYTICSMDVRHLRKTEIQHGYMPERDVALIAHGYVLGLRLQPFPALSELATWFVGRSRFIWGNPIFTPTVMARKHSFVRFDHRYRRINDYKCRYENLQNGDLARFSLDLAGRLKSDGLTLSARVMHWRYLEVLNALRAEATMLLGNYLGTVLCAPLKYPMRSLSVRLRNN